MRCPKCGYENPGGQRFCGDCGHRLEAVTPPIEVRKTVTVVFTDVTGSTALGERLDPEALRRVMTRYFDEMRTVLERHGGTVEKFIGDAVMAVFGVPLVHEDDALRATRAAVEMRDALAVLNKELERDFSVTIANRTGVNTGEVVAGAGEQTIATGDAVNTAARLEQGASPGEILIGDATYRLVRDAVAAEEISPIDAKGKTDPVSAWRLSAVHPSAEGIARRRDAPMVGRQRELRLLTEAFDRAIADRACVLFTILGTPGVGKSRLVERFLESVEARALRGRCLPYGDGITYWPVVEMLTRAADLTDVDSPDQVRARLRALVGNDDSADLVAERLAQLLGVAGASAAAEETFWAVRKLFELLARTQPLVVDLDDIQWAEPAMFDLIEHVADWTRDAPVLLLCSARPDLLDERATWGGGKRNAASIELEPLSTDETGLLVDELLAGVPPEVADRIATAAEGIPLFVEHLAAILQEDGTLTRDGDTWTVRGDLASLAVPPTISALIEARLERLPADELAVLERASIEGKQFHRGAVIALTPEAERSSVGERLMALARRDLIRPGESLLTGEDGLAFRHLLIRDAAYARIPKEGRADLHVRYASWLEAAAGDREAEFDEIAGYHFEQAARLWGELAPSDKRARDAGLRAADRLGSAGHRAVDRGDVRAAARLLRRADELLREDSTARAPILLDIGIAYERQGDNEGAVAVLSTAERLARELGDLTLVARAMARRQLARSHLEGTSRELEVELEALLPELEAAGADLAIAEILYFLGVSNHWRGFDTRGIELLQRAEALGARSGAAIGAAIGADAAALAVSAMTFGPEPAASAEAKWVEMRESIVARRARAIGDGLNSLAVGMLGKFERARDLWHGCHEELIELGDELYAAGGRMHLAYIELLAGQPEAAVTASVRGEHDLELLGEHGFRSTMECYLADAYHVLGRLDDVIAATERAEANTSPEDYETNAGWRSARARALADSGRPQEAERRAREAVEIAEGTEAIETQARQWASLGYVLATAGRRDHAVEAFRQALDRYEQKGNLVSSSRLRRTIATLLGEPPPSGESLPPGAWGTTWPLR
jgi:class 3 adenylate cyclase/tetratricopeptide (TPR) repeat protein